MLETLDLVNEKFENKLNVRLNLFKLGSQAIISIKKLGKTFNLKKIKSIVSVNNLMVSAYQAIYHPSTHPCYASS